MILLTAAVTYTLIYTSHDVTLMQILQGKGSTYFGNLTALRTALSPALAWKVLCIQTAY